MKKDNEQTLIDTLSSASRAMSAKELSLLLNVSTRSIGNYVREINRSNSTVSISSDENGYTLIYKNSKDDNKTESDLNPIRRYDFLLNRLLNEKEVDIYDLSEEIYVSDSTLAKSFSKINNYIKPYHLNIIQRKGVYSIQGTEEDKRKLLSNMILHESKQFSNYCLNDISAAYAKDTALLKQEILKILDKHGLYANGYRIDNIIIHLLICISRIKNHNYIEEEDFLSFSTVSHAYIAANEIAEFFSKKYAIEIPTTEIEYMATIFKEKTSLSLIKSDLPQEVLSNYIEDTYLSITKEIVDAISSYYLLDFDEDFFTRFAFHIKALAHRSITHHYASNPHTDITKARFPFAFEIGVFVSDILKKHGIDLNDDEIAYLSFHVGSYLKSDHSEDTVNILLLMRNYINLSKNIIQRVQGKYGSDIRIDTTQALTTDTSDYDLIVTTDTVITNQPVILISPLLSENEFYELCIKIDELIKHKENRKIVKQYQSSLRSAYFKKNIVSNDYLDLLKTLCAEVVQGGYANKNFFEEVKERELLSSTAFYDGIAIPHTLKMNQIQNCMSIVINDKPIAWNGKNVYVIILFSLSENDRIFFRQFTDILIEKIYNTPNYIQEMQRIESYDGFMDWMIR